MQESARETPSWADPVRVRCGFLGREGGDVAALACVKQVHGAQVHAITDESTQPPSEGDALWTAVPGLAVAVRVADCVPILLWDPGVPAVAAVHAGWRGTALDIAGAALSAGRERLGVEPSRCFAALGPCIGPECFEVGEEVVGALRELGLDDAALGLWLGPRGRPHLDLRAANRALLRRAGLADGRIEDVGGCTMCNPLKYESFRRDRGASGRMRGWIELLRSGLPAGLLGVALLFAAGCGAGVATGCRAPGDGVAGAEPDAALLDDSAFSAAADAARQALDEGRAAAAEEQARALLAARPGDAWARLLLGRALHAQGRFREAGAQAALAHGADPTLWQAAWAAAAAHARLGENDPAVAWLQVALTTGGGAAAGDGAGAGGGDGGQGEGGDGPVSAARATVDAVLADPDLSTLQKDHRFAFFQASGLLSRDEEDAIAVVQPASVTAGDRATLTLVSVALNRPLLGAREDFEVRFLGELADGALVPVSRRETFSTGAEGGLEYRQHTVHYGFVARVPGVHALGPFEVRQGQSRVRTGTPLLQVRPAPLPTPLPQSAAGGPPSDFLYFSAPSIADGALLASHEAAGGAAVELDPSRSEPVHAAWAQGDGLRSRVWRFRALRTDGLPAAIPPAEPGSFRSVLVQRGSEGWSHVIEIAPDGP